LYDSLKTNSKSFHLYIFAFDNLTEKILKVKSIGQGTRRLCRMNKFGFPCSKPRKKYNIPWRTGDITELNRELLGVLSFKTKNF
jgi:hypothetical protein